MSTQFISRVERDEPGKSINNSSDIGPGSYLIEGALKKGLPGFAPFSSNTKRMTINIVDETPAPGSYNVSKELTKKTYGAGSLHSKSKRFDSVSVDESIPGPGNYVLPSSFKAKKEAAMHRRSEHLVNEALAKSLGVPITTVAPSIPTRFQSYGYEHGPDGRLHLQNPLYPVYTGRANDTVGPCEYDPNINIKFKSAPKTNFSNATPRQSAVSARESPAPGPGYYNLHSDFDIPEEGSHYNDTNFIMQLNAARKRQSAAFESKTTRDAFLSDVIQKIDQPGPGYYQLPTAIKVKTVPPEKQNFSSSGDRFRDPTPRSMRTTTAPGAYSPVTSDFDQSRLKILKQKKMASRSGWAQNIAFTSTETRFQHNGGTNEIEGPPPNAYYPKIGIADHIVKENVRGAPFGGREERFKPKKSNFLPTNDPFSMATAALTKELENLNLVPPHRQQQGSHGGGFNYPSHNTRPKFSSAFAPSGDDRLRPVKTPPGPPPGAYDTVPKWDKIGTVVMAPEIGKQLSKKRADADIAPGPGQYRVARKLGSDWRNPKNIMLSSSKREIFHKPDNIPGPGEYELAKGLIRPSYNVLLSDNY